jgi:hypothetical protein
MRYAAVYKTDSEPFERFVKRKGGINACVQPGVQEGKY